MDNKDNKKDNDFLTKEEYLTNFGVYPDEKVCDKENKKIKAALEIAWKNRDFEIDKFWSRTAYFWAFIVLCFTGYGALKYGVEKPSHIALLAISALGVISSFIWMLSIKASKRWQENWERHIDCLEDYVTGPLYKTIVYKNKVPSVSKLNFILSFIILITWIIIFIIELFGVFNSFIVLPCLVCCHSKLIVCLLLIYFFWLFFIDIFFLLGLVLWGIYEYSTTKNNKVERFEKSRDINDYFEEKETNNTKDNK